MDELISVIVPIYNTEEYLPQCIESILGQSYRKLEILLIDDGSTDKSGEICDKYAEQDKRIRVLHQENKGLVQSRKIGLSEVTGKYVGFVDSDDWIEKEMFEYLYHQIKTTKAQVVTSGRYVETNQSCRIEDNIKPGLYNPMTDEYFCKHMIFGDNKLIWGITPNFWNKLFEKDNLMKWEMNVPNEITYGEDDACVYPCMAFSEKIYVSDKCFYHYRVRNTSMSNSSDEMYFTRINVLYVTLKNAFEKHPLHKILMRELGDYMFEFALRGINGLWGLETSLSIPRQWVDIGILLKGKKILLYGAGLIGKEYYRQFVFMGLEDNICWVDKKADDYKKNGFPVITLDEVTPEEIDLVIISIGNNQIAAEVKIDLINKGFSEEEIFWCRPRNILDQELCC